MTEIALQQSFEAHRMKLSSVVNTTLKDQSLAVVDSLSEMQQQQQQFYEFMKNMQKSIDIIHDKQIEHDSHFNEVLNWKKRESISDQSLSLSSSGNQQIIRKTRKQHSIKKDNFLHTEYSDIMTAPLTPNSVEISVDDNIIAFANIEEYESDDSLLNDATNAHRLMGNERRPSQRELFTSTISSMRLYLENARQKSVVDERNENAPIFVAGSETKINDGFSNIAKNMKSDIFSVESKLKDHKIRSNSKLDETKEDLNRILIKQISTNNNFTVGKKIDILDVSYHWYSSTILDIDIFQRKSIRVKYDGFQERWNEWIPFVSSFRISQHKTRSLGHGKADGGVHVLIATKYGKSLKGKQLRAAVDVNDSTAKSLKEVKILMAGHMFKRGNWNKNWKHRWFVLRNNNRLYYYGDKTFKLSQYRGVIALGNVRKIERAYIDMIGKSAFTFFLQTPDRKYHFGCETEVDLIDWLSVLNCLINNPLESMQPLKKSLLNKSSNTTSKNINSIRQRLSMFQQKNISCDTIKDRKKSKPTHKTTFSLRLNSFSKLLNENMSTERNKSVVEHPELISRAYTDGNFMVNKIIELELETDDDVVDCSEK